MGDLTTTSSTSSSTRTSMIFIGRNPGPRYLVARRENKTRWERHSKIFGSNKSVNCLVGDSIGIRFERSVKNGGWDQGGS